MRFAALALIVVVAPTPLLAQQPPPLVAPTNAQSPADERKGFTVPAGFDVQLVASEPDIQKPMQMAFDAKGRLWVTTSYHYPFAAPLGKGTDKLFILSDIDPATGKAGKVQVFADDLNIPIGVLPLPDCKSVIVSSIGEIRKYTDTNDDGKADKMEVLFSGFGYVDTHGMYNSYTLMPDGWVYACHGFRNDSKVKGKDGHEVTMNSGNTFRFRPDGSRIEVYSRGQVNPFGITVDPWFNLYTADCHSRPITQIIPGAYYQSFGKPHDGLGFAPHVTGHDHGSTGLCGLVWYDADQFPKEYLGCMFVGNVVTSRINFDKIEWHGSSPVAKELPDFMTSKDLWFRPTDIKLGPDGALYVTDFYNKIIGHYEVDLKHPGRDHDHGRLWRIVWKGKDGEAPVSRRPFADLTKTTERDLVKLVSEPNLAVRLAVANQLATRGEKGVNAFPSLQFPNPTVDVGRVYTPFVTLAERAGLMKDEQYPQLWRVIGLGEGQAGVDELAVGMARGLATRKDWGDGARTAAEKLLKHEAPKVRRVAVEAVIFHPHADFVAPLVELLKKCPADDTHLRQAARIALRNCLLGADTWPNDSGPIYADIALAIPDSKAATYLLLQIKAKTVPGGKLTAAAEHVARYGTPGDEHLLFESLRSLTSDQDPEPFLAAFRGVQARGSKLDKEAARYLLDSAQNAIQWAISHEVLAGKSPTPDEAKAAMWSLRVLNALPGVLDKESNPKAYSLSSRSVQNLTTAIERQAVSDDIRAAAAEVLLRYRTDTAVKVIRQQIGKGNLPQSLRDRLLLVLAASSNKEARLDARDALKDAPYRTAVAVGTALAGSPAGADDLLTAVKMGKAPARLLQEKVILERLRAAKIANLDRQLAALTKGLPPLDQKIAALLKKRASTFASAKSDKELGAKLFTKHCGACHKIGEMGGKIAPQLDGIGNRGLERVLEDVLDPNRNVDQAFRARIITTKDERTITGLMLRVEGEVVVVADAEGKEVRIPTKEIDSNRETMLSPMPANFGDVIPEADFNHLLAYLLDQKAKEPPK